MDYRFRLVRQFLHCFWEYQPWGPVGPNYNQAVGTCFYFPAVLISIFTLILMSSSFSLIYFILAVLLRNCSGEYSCMSSIFTIATVNGTCFLRETK